MIDAVLIFNNDGKPRLMNWYQQLDIKEQQKRLEEIYHLVRSSAFRPEHSCNFLDGLTAETRIVYRHYATLYFVFVVDSSESELGILDLIQVFVESLDTVFTNVCELDLIFRPDDVQLVLSEIVAGGMVLEVHADVIQHGLQIAQTKRKTVR
ncbi:AP-3 complex subunit sigma-2 [Kappamyces sp. JEL0829]|nr:AP-3 complex subunit sigma-2 [Kappamyces sp. JEL0829]